MTDNQLLRRYKILENVCSEKRNNYSIRLDGSSISIRNTKTQEGIYTDSLQNAKRWILKDMEEKIIMMTSAECAETWKEVVRIYNETRESTPEVTVDKIIDALGIEKTKEVFATVAAIKKHDGRIYGKNREYMNSIPVNPKSAERNHENRMVYAGLDDIHTTHINQLITELKKKADIYTR